MTFGHGLVVFFAGSALLLAALAHDHDDAKPEQPIQQVEHKLNPPVVYRYPEQSLTCFWWPDVKQIQCVPNYQLGTRQKYEG